MRRGPVASVCRRGRHHGRQRALRVAPRLPFVSRAWNPLPESVLLRAAGGLGFRAAAGASRRRATCSRPPPRAALSGPGWCTGVGFRRRGERGARMTVRSSNCPNCGAPVVFGWSSSVQTVCEYCKSILVRTDVDLQKVGVVADLPVDASPIQRLTEGRFDDRHFVVTGRILYEYDQGGWNEWHLAFDGGADGWLSDAQNQFAVSFRADLPNLPGPDDAPLGRSFTW